MLLEIRGGMFPVFAGIGIGTAGGLALTHLIKSFLYEIKPTAPASFVTAAVAF
jgi:hypothetical protein